MKILPPAPLYMTLEILGVGRENYPPHQCPHGSGKGPLAPEPCLASWWWSGACRPPSHPREGKVAAGHAQGG